MVNVMDTIFYESKKHYKFAVNVINIAIIVALCLNFPKTLLAQETVLIANTVTPIINAGKIEKAVSNAINKDEEAKNFNKSIKSRYKNNYCLLNSISMEKTSIETERRKPQAL